MNNKTKQGIQSLEKIKLFMNYSLEKTLSENILEQEHIKTKSDLMYQDWEKEERDSESAKEEAEKNNCNLITTEKDHVRINEKFKSVLGFKEGISVSNCTSLFGF